MPDISAIQNTPDVSFIDNKTIDDVRGDMVADFEAFMLQATGSKVSLGRASVHRMILYSAAAQIYQAMQYVDRAGKQSLLKYSYSEFLDNLALLKGVTREPAKAATTTIRFTASATRTLATPIPAGTRVSSSGSIYFSTMEYAEIPAGSLTVDVLAECTATGNAGNGLAPGEVSTIVDPVPYITSAVNQNTTEGGADVENDESLAERVYLAPGAYSTAGPEDGYLYHAKKYNAAIGDVVATSDHEAGQVDIVFIMADGSKPGAAMISGLQAYLSGKTIRPMTDKLTVKAPEEVTYSIIGTTPPARRPMRGAVPSVRATTTFSALSTPAAAPALATPAIPGRWPPAFLSNRRSISGKIPPTEVGGKPGQRKKTREVKECQF